MQLNSFQKACLYFTAFLLLYWVIMFANGLKGGFYNNLFAFLYGLTPLLGGAAALKGYRDWGGSSTILGRAIRLIGFGLFLWGLGELVWSYYNFFGGIDIPYPSLADVFFAPSVFFYTLGTVYLSTVMGARIGLASAPGKVFAALAGLCVLIAAYFVLIVGAKNGVLISDGTSFIKSILDIAYPLGDAVSLGVSVVIAGLSFKYLGGLYKYDFAFILIGLALMFVSDSAFSYLTTVGKPYNGGPSDMLFAIALFFITSGLLGFNKIRRTTPAIS